MLMDYRAPCKLDPAPGVWAVIVATEVTARGPAGVVAVVVHPGE